MANYTGGSVAVFPILADGKIGEASAFVQHTGHGADPKRQEGPHAHSIDLSPDNRFAFVDDLGLDELLAYKFDRVQGIARLLMIRRLRNSIPVPGRGISRCIPPGSSRTWSAKCKGTVTVFSHDPSAGTFQPLQTLTTLPKDFTGENEDAEIEVHPSGKVPLRIESRGRRRASQSIAIDPDKGTLTPVENVSTRRQRTPRNFEIDPTGKFLFAENAEVKQHRHLPHRPGDGTSHTNRRESWRCPRRSASGFFLWCTKRAGSLCFF